MSDERGKLNNEDIFGNDDMIFSGEIVDMNSDGIGSVDDIIASVKYGDTDRSKSGGNFAPNVIASLDDALRVVDSSNLPPSPASRGESALGGRTDKYGLPINQPRPPAVNLPAETKKSANLPATRPPYAPNTAAMQSNALVKRQSGAVAKAPPVTPAVTATSAAHVAPAAHVASKSVKPDPKLHIPKLKELFSGPDPKKPKTKAPNAEPTDFKIKFDFDSAYKDPPENRPLRRRRERRTGLVGGLMFAAFILCVALVLASVMWLITMDVLGFGSADEEVDIQVPEGFTMENVTDMLHEAGLIRYKTLFNIFADYSKAEEKIAPGVYVLNKNFDYRSLVQGMTARAGVRVETTVTIPEGFTLSQIFNLLEIEEVCSAESLWDTATNYDFDFYFLDKDTIGNKLRLEGFLFPDTYNFYKDSTPVRVITRMLREFDSKLTETYYERAEHLGYTVREIVTIASMIEREAGSDEERPRIAAVIYNRLNSPASYPYLEIDATIHYAIAGTNIPFSITLESEFNSYTNPGLPPGPIANPGMESIRAALYPDSTNEYFYALNKSGTHNFFRNATDHTNFVNSDEYGG